jgi:hypothetical protein
LPHIFPIALCGYETILLGKKLLGTLETLFYCACFLRSNAVKSGQCSTAKAGKKPMGERYAGLSATARHPYRSSFGCLE